MNPAPALPPGGGAHRKDGSFTNTQRMLQWHHTAVEPVGDARSDLWFTYHLGRKIREKLAGSGDEMDRPVLDLTWDYSVSGALYEPDAEAVLSEIKMLRTSAGPTGSPAAALSGRNRVVAAAGGAALVAASAPTRFGVFYAGRESARDPRYTVGPQRNLLQEGGRG